MTGFARESGAISDRYFLSLSARSVNHRYLEISVRLPEFLWEMEQIVRSIASGLLVRGKVDVMVRATRTTEADYDIQVNTKIADRVIPRVHALMSEHGFGGGFTASDILRIPDLLEVRPVETELTEEEQSAFRDLLRSLFERLGAMRSSEGEGLYADLERRIDAVDRLRKDLERDRESIMQELVGQFRLRVEEIARSVDVDVCEDRIAQELVIQAERADVAEELTRLKIHLEQMRILLTSEEAAGKKLDFLSQEVLRETNTLGQKSRSSTIRSVVVELKSEVERIREQVQNVE
ncbi:MAG TPA: YicC/YloC family endoribonuclease [Thermoanaerobaculia bacterium]|nr:YicC/YloC family endoribonuclease [Thermoanaerobaculia bacterium]